ncbi:hypothetical protein NUU61_006460 [Penicillium alfredii]|uniref:Uncharacterized protein n=1 Tax=Penicillium alfredii TaxID=1506179 RepID=A0A9W9K3M9_9EURO|nr:uncharacterized protein NUU61_006460 [Penicillium alfredii]KAJ5091590.1 hypothetical protein NUU61_006460 [Penicillium alfredii]
MFASILTYQSKPPYTSIFDPGPTGAGPGPAFRAVDPRRRPGTGFWTTVPAARSFYYTLLYAPFQLAGQSFHVKFEVYTAWRPNIQFSLVPIE